MTGAPDGDVDRALASINATPLKYHSFGVVSVRPPGSDAATTEAVSAHGRLGDAYGAPAPGLPPTGEGTTGRYRVHAVSTVFPLLGLALPEAFQIDVEPVWPVGPPVSDQGMLLDRPPVMQHGHRNTNHETGYQAPAKDPWPEPMPSSSMPPWLDPLPRANPLNQLPDEPVSAMDPHRNFPEWNASSVEPSSLHSSEPGRARRLNMWGDELGSTEPAYDDPFGGRSAQTPDEAGREGADHRRPAPPSEFSPFGQNGVGSPGHAAPTPAEPPSWLNHEFHGGRSAVHETLGTTPISDWTLPEVHLSRAEPPPASPMPEPHPPASWHERDHPHPEFPEPTTSPPLVSAFDDQRDDDAISRSISGEGPDLSHAPVFQPAIDAEPAERDMVDRHEEFMPHQASGHEPADMPGPSAQVDVPMNLASAEPFHDNAQHPTRDPYAPDPYAPSRYQPFDAEPTWHDAPAAPGPAAEVAAGSGIAAWLQPGGTGAVDATPETAPTPVSVASSSTKARPLADMFRTLGAGPPRSHSGSS
jgi:hypothetical protein